MRRLQIVGIEWLQASHRFATELVAHYAAGGSPSSRARSGNRGAEANIDLQWRAKIGECAVALIFDLNPTHAVGWSLAPDAGFDVVSNFGVRMDVKTTLPPRRLIWSNNINDLYHQKQFDVLVSVSIPANKPLHCYVDGYVSKADFFARKEIADGTCGLERGTWFMHKADLADIAELIEGDT